MDQIAGKMTRCFGERRAFLALGVVGLICALPLFFKWRRFTAWHTARAWTKEKVMAVCSAALQPAGIILLVTGAGGVF
ncbi:GntT/GntP/DsdX family permease [Martelella alba]|uniref:GntT/GntP/DsdX family permease n=1 Tax=Martelella alba TaxID=2590451 RepID=UPI0027D21FA1|nr:hypothetical protein [Martelella alba]